MQGNVLAWRNTIDSENDLNTIERVKKKESHRPGSNQRPQDDSLIYSLALFQLSYGEICLVANQMHFIMYSLLIAFLGQFNGTAANIY